jgi:hypothetical protein
LVGVAPTVSALAGDPTPQELVNLACEAAGGTKAYQQLGILQIDVAQNEIAQDGTPSETKTTFFLTPPGPLPGRLQIAQAEVLAGDDGSGGWGIAGDKPDDRPQTTYMVRRLLQTDLFAVLLPFSLSWNGINLGNVVAADVAGRQVWRLSVEMDSTFFFSPQVSRTWTIDFDRQTYRLVGMECPVTDLGPGMRTDGQRISFSDPVQLKGVTLFGSKKVIGLNETGTEMAHNRVDHLRFQLPTGLKAARVYGNPLTPDKRPKLPVMQAPQGLPNVPKS